MNSNRFEKKIRVVIFGARDGGIKLTKEIEEKHLPFEVVAYLDNDSSLWTIGGGGGVLGKPVLPPGEVVNCEYDEILLAVLDKDSVINQMVSKHGVDIDKINWQFYEISYKRPWLKVLTENAQFINDNVAGACAELGVFQGDFAQHINEQFPERTLYLFDTFDGHPESDIEKDVEIGCAKSRYQNFRSTTSVELVLSKMKHKEKIVVRKGIFPDTLMGLEQEFAFVSIDVDLYNPTLEGLKYFYPRLSKHGLIFIRGFYSEYDPGVRKAVLDYKNKMDIQIISMGDHNSIIIPK
ncbi:MAG: TylF/MycF family methyltransferase [Bacteroidales bacterium]|jgi:O-methyltransferase|nr:TylF/MycF family methyltransferase [Bacteroidales bacterium]